MDKENLTLLGFNRYTSRIIESLLGGEILSVKEIYEKTKIPKNKIYENLEILLSKSIISVEEGKPKRYFLLNDSLLEDMIENRENDLNNLKEKIKEIKKSRDKIHPSVLSIIEGRDELHKLIEYSNLSIKKEILSCSRLTKMHYGCFRTLKDAIRRGVKVKFIGLYNGKNYPVLKAYHDVGVEIRIYAPKNGIFPRIGIFDDSYARISIDKPDVDTAKHIKTIWANSAILHEIVKNHFERLWNDSEIFDPKNFKR